MIGVSHANNLQKMINLILTRHGQSEWNANNQFTGWVDSGLSNKGRDEAKLAGKLIKNANIKISYSFTSFLKRAQDTLKIILHETNNNKIPIKQAWELNERHYGSLTGLNKIETKDKLGEVLFNTYRRSWDIAPPSLDRNSEHLKNFSNLNLNIPSNKIPTAESLRDTYERVIPYYLKNIFPLIESDNKILIAAHGNSLRALCKYIFKISNTDISKLEIPTGNPLCVEFNISRSEVVNAFYLDLNRKKSLFI